MRLKTKLVLAISALVFLIAGTVSLVYVHQLVKAAVLQTYDTNRMMADQVWYALQHATGRLILPIPPSFTIWWRRRFRMMPRCRPRSIR
jgi:hypothetical protein